MHKEVFLQFLALIVDILLFSGGEVMGWYILFWNDMIINRNFVRAESGETADSERVVQFDYAMVAVGAV